MNRVLKLRTWKMPGVLVGKTAAQEARTRADRKLAMRIAATFEGLEVPSGESVSIFVRDARVMVCGLVCDEADREFVVQLLHRVPGVESVVAQMQLVKGNELESLDGSEDRR